MPHQDPSAALGPQNLNPEDPYAQQSFELRQNTLQDDTEMEMESTRGMPNEYENAPPRRNRNETPIISYQVQSVNSSH
jgi:hypothetical protein